MATLSGSDKRLVAIIAFAHTRHEHYDYSYGLSNVPDVKMHGLVPLIRINTAMRSWVTYWCISASLVMSAHARLEVCGTDCQNSQRLALQQIYSETGGPHWHRSAGWTTQPCGAACSSWPQHCTWSGVHCCLSAGVLGSGAPHFPSNAAINCTMVGGVSALLLPKQNMHGSIPDSVWPMLSGSMTYLDFSGTKPFHFVQSPKHLCIWLGSHH